MDQALLREFQRQVWLQGRFALHAIAVFDASLIVEHVEPDYRSFFDLRDYPPDTPVAKLLDAWNEGLARTTEAALGPQIATWAAVQSFLSAAANISKALWGEGGRLAVERKPLRESLGVEDGSPLFATAMRNNFDHFDDRLDKWWADGGGCIVDLSFLNPAHLVRGDGVGTGKGFFRNFDPATGNLTFWDKTYHLPTIVDEIKRTTDIALRESVKPRGLYPTTPGDPQHEEWLASAEGQAWLANRSGSGL